MNNVAEVDMIVISTAHMTQSKYMLSNIFDDIPELCILNMYFVLCTILLHYIIK